MKNVGFHGGHSVYEVGPASDMATFFNCLRTYVVQADSETDYQLLTDRLFRRYLRQSELAFAAALMERAGMKLSAIATSVVDWNAMGRVESESQLDTSAPFLSDVFRKHLDGFAKAVGSASSFSSKFEKYKPVKVVFSDMPRFFIDKMRPLDDYDKLEGAPFWLG